MKGKFVNFCMALLNILIGLSILIYSLKIPKDITELTVQEYDIVKILKIVIYVGLGLSGLLNIIQYFINDRDGLRKTGYLFGIFSLSFIFIKEWPIFAFGVIAGIMITISTIRERWIETNSITMISIIGIISLIFVFPIIGSFSYKTIRCLCFK